MRDGGKNRTKKIKPKIFVFINVIYGVVIEAKCLGGGSAL